MSPQVTAALISGGAALVVALLGIAGAVVAQLVTTRRAFANSLALFEQEYLRREREQAAATSRDDARRLADQRREDAYRFADQRRSTYARLLRTAADLYETRGSICKAANKWEDRYHREHGAGQDGTPTESVFEAVDRARAAREAWERALEEPAAELRDAYARWERTRVELDEVAEEVELLASPDVRSAAGELAYFASTLPDFGEAWRVLRWIVPPAPRWSAAALRNEQLEDYHPARDAFLEAARRELGIVVKRDSEAGTGPPPLQI